MEHVGLLSLVPPVIAIILAFLMGNIVFSLFLGTFTGILILLNGNPLHSVTSMIGDYFFVQLTDSYNAGILTLLIFIGGFVALMEKSDGAAAFAEKVAKFINTRVKAQLSAWFGGIIIFFSDLGTPLIVGPIFEPIFDKLKVSREKLAWNIDSTASPVAVMVPFIGWGVYIMGLINMGLINQEFESLGVNQSDFSAFMHALPFYIYPMLAFLIIPVMVLMKTDFGPMKKAEQRIIQTGEIYWSNAKPMRKSEAMLEIKNTKSKPILIWLPLLVLFVTLFGLLIPKGFPFTAVPGNDFRVALTTSYLFAGVTLIVLMVFYKVKKFGQTFDIYLSGMQRMVTVCIILVLAWSLGTVMDQLGTANYIVQLMEGNIATYLIPAIIFVISCIMSFACGTSWGTFAIMLPLAIPLAVHLDLSISICIGAVISGGVFGDHCSPISDTTILSSTGAGTDHTDHNKTQIPIALFNGGITLIAFLFAGVTENVYTALLAIALMVISVIFIKWINKRRDRNSSMSSVI